MTPAPEGTSADEASAEQASAEQAAHATVEAAVRRQLGVALGGRRGVLESAVPTLAFTLVFLALDDLRLALVVAGSAAGVLLLLRLVQRSTVQFVLNSLLGIGLGAVFALRSGEAADVFLPGILYNAAYGAAMLVSIAVRWPVVGFLIGSVTGDPTGWRADPGVLRLCSRLTWLLLLPCVVRVAVQLPLYLADAVGWLGASKVALGWPLQLLALAAAAALLARGRTPLAPRPT